MICSYCNSEFEGKFCPNCGAPAPVQAPVVNNTHIQDKPINNPPVQNHYQQGPRKLRRGMKVGMIICLVFAGIYALIGLSMPYIFSMTFFFLVLAVMFLLLGHTPKESQYMFGKPNGIKKKSFVLACILIACVVFGILGSVLPQPETDDSSTSNGTSQSQGANSDTNTTLNDVEKWYKNQTSAVSQSLIEYAKSVNGLTTLNVTSSQFRFGEDSGWYDCHYTFYFTCKINGVNYDGEARAFMKYQDSTVNWFHFEIFSNSGIQPLVEHYDDSYDKIIEDYYMELEDKYN